MKHSSPPLPLLALLALSLVACGSRTLTLTDPDNHATASDGSVPDGAVTPGGRDCDGSPHGMTEQRVRYGAAEVGPDEGCTSESQQRQCQDGTWSEWSGSYAADDCMMHAARDCDGVRSGDTETRHGYQERTRYATQTVAHGQSCDSVELTQVRSCAGMKWSDWEPAQAFETCVVAPPLVCGSIAHAEHEQRVRYAAERVPYGSRCDAVAQVQTNTCDNGVLQGFTGDSVAYPHATCEVTPPADCGAVAHGTNETRTCFPAARIAYGQVCAQTATQQFRACDNGSFGPWSAECVSSTCEDLPPASDATRQDGGTPQVGARLPPAA